MGNGRFRKRENNFTQVSNGAITDPNLSSKSLGLYCRINYYITIPEWDLYKSHLIQKCPEGKKAFESMWNELKEAGYLVQHRMRDEKGNFYYEYELLDKVHRTPQNGVPVFPVPEKSDTGSMETGKGGVYNNTDFNNILNNNTDGSKNDTHICSTKNVCECSVNENISLDELRLEAEKVIGEKIWKNEFDSAMKNVTVEKFKEHLSNWHIHKINAKKAGAYFIRVLINDIEPVIPQQIASYNINNNKVPQRDNFDQREYSDEELDKYYANLRE